MPSGGAAAAVGRGMSRPREGTRGPSARTDGGGDGPRVRSAARAAHGCGGVSASRPSICRSSSRPAASSAAFCAIVAEASARRWVVRPTQSNPFVRRVLRGPLLSTPRRAWRAPVGLGVVHAPAGGDEEHLLARDAAQEGDGVAVAEFNAGNVGPLVGVASEQGGGVELRAADLRETGHRIEGVGLALVRVGEPGSVRGSGGDGGDRSRVRAACHAGEFGSTRGVEESDERVSTADPQRGEVSEPQRLQRDHSREAIRPQVDPRGGAQKMLTRVETRFRLRPRRGQRPLELKPRDQADETDGEEAGRDEEHGDEEAAQNGQVDPVGQGVAAAWPGLRERTGLRRDGGEAGGTERRSDHFTPA